MNEIAISIIIPIYNASRYLERCLCSVINQTFQDFELILVDDGSQDNSLEICKKFKERDPRIKIISQLNRGSSIARNVGLDSSSGKYIINIDADDWMESNMLETMYFEASKTNADIIMSGFYIDYQSGMQKKISIPYHNEEGQCPLKIHMGYSAFWNKLIKRQLYLDYNIKGLEGITIWDDNVVTLRLRYHSKKTICIDDALYHYCVGTGSSMCDHSFGKFPHSEIKAAKFLNDYFKNIAPNDKLAKYCIANSRVLAKSSIWRIESFGGVKKWKEILPTTISDIWISQLKNKEKLILSIISFLPLSISELIVKFIFKITK